MISLYLQNLLIDFTLLILIVDFTVLIEDVGKENHASCSNVHTFFTKVLIVDKGKTRHLYFFILLMVGFPFPWSILEGIFPI